MAVAERSGALFGLNDLLILRTPNSDLKKKCNLSGQMFPGGVYRVENQ